MFWMNSPKKWASLVLSLVLLFSLAGTIIPQTVIAEGKINSPYIKTITDKDGTPTH